MTTSPEYTEVVCHTREEIFLTRISGQAPLVYDRILGVSLTEVADDCAAEISGYDATSMHGLYIPLSIGRRMLWAVRAIENGQDMNCIRFSRALIGRDVSDEQASIWPDGDELDHLQPVESLDVGQVGYITVPGAARPMHSIIGLGADDSRGLQVMSRQHRQIGLADNKNVLDFYGQSYPGSEVGLYAANDSSPFTSSSLLSQAHTNRTSPGEVQS